MLTHWGRVTHICVGNLTIIGSDNGLSPVRRQAIIWTNAEILLIGPLVYVSEIQIGIQTFSYKKMHLKMSSVKWRIFCLGLNVLTTYSLHVDVLSHPSGGSVPWSIIDCSKWMQYDIKLLIIFHCVSVYRIKIIRLMRINAYTSSCSTSTKSDYKLLWGIYHVGR